MSAGLKWKRLSGALLLGACVLCVGTVSLATTAPQHSARKKASKKPQLLPPPLPSGPTGPVQAIPLDAIAAVPPQVSYQNSQLTIVAPNSTLADILRAVRKQTGADIEVPAAPERVVTHLGPGPARDVLAELLNGSRFNYVLLGSQTDDSALTKVVLVAKTGSDTIAPPPPTPDPALGIAQANTPPAPAQEQQQPDTAEADQVDDNAANVDDAAAQDQPPQEAEQQPNPNEQQQPGVKTPQQMLQEMQQRQLQMQQQQPPGQPPIPGSGMPPHPPQEP
jgi:hypothetical protein